MAKTISFDKMENVRVIFDFNVNTEKIAQTGDWHIAKIVVEGESVGEGRRHLIASSSFLGSAESDEFTPNEIYVAIQNLNRNWLANKIKDLYIEGVNTDIST